MVAFSYYFTFFTSAFSRTPPPPRRSLPSPPSPPQVFRLPLFLSPPSFAPTTNSSIYLSNPLKVSFQWIRHHDLGVHVLHMRHRTFQIPSKDEERRRREKRERTTDLTTKKRKRKIRTERRYKTRSIPLIPLSYFFNSLVLPCPRVHLWAVWICQ